MTHWGRTNRAIFPLQLLPSSPRGDEAPEPFCTAQLHAAETPTRLPAAPLQRWGTQPSSFPGPETHTLPPFLHETPLLRFSSPGRFVSAPSGLLLPSRGKPRALNAPAAVPSPAAALPARSSCCFPTRTRLAGRPEHRLPKHLLPHLPRSKGHAYAGSPKAQFQFRGSARTPEEEFPGKQECPKPGERGSASFCCPKAAPPL